MLQCLPYDARVEQELLLDDPEVILTSIFLASKHSTFRGSSRSDLTVRDRKPNWLDQC